MMKKRIYLDYAATTPIDSKALKAMMPYLKGSFGNPSSAHSFGQFARAGIEKAREHVAGFLNCNPLEIVFTSGATEANNLAIQGAIRSRASENKKARLWQKPHIITSQIEHESVLSPCEVLEQEGLAEVTYIPVDTEGLVRVEDVKNAIKENTALVSIMYANSEIGTVQPIAEIGAMLGKIKNQKSNLKNTTQNSKILFHTDAAQAAQFLDCDVQKFGVDLLTLSSHKIYGPKGAGVLYVREGLPLSPALYGGGQEQGLRSGTENVAAIVGMGAAIEEIQNPKSKVQNIKIRQLRDQLIRGILRNVKGAELTGLKEKRLPNNIHIRVRGVEGRDVVIALDQKGIAVSSGSACSEKNQEPSRVLLALGYPAQEASSGVRLTLGKHTTQEEIQKTIRMFVLAIEELRRNL